MKNLLNEIDELLVELEGYTRGQTGERITQMRGKILAALRQTEVTPDFEAILAKCKDEVARKHCYPSWDSFVSTPFDDMDEIFTEAALLAMQRVARREGEAVEKGGAKC